MYLMFSVINFVIPSRSISGKSESCSPSTICPSASIFVFTGTEITVDVFDVFGQSIRNYGQLNFTALSDSDIDRQLRAADVRIGSYGFCNLYILPNGAVYLHILASY